MFSATTKNTTICNYIIVAASMFLLCLVTVDFFNNPAKIAQQKKLYDFVKVMAEIVEKRVMST